MQTSQLHEARPVLWKLARDYIRDYIVNHKLRSGDALPSEGQIAKDLGISRSSVREAVRALESLGVLDVRHGNGLFVRGLNYDAVLTFLSYSVMFEPSALLDLLRVRKLVESGIMPEVVRRIQPDELDKCRQIFTEWEANLNAGLPYSEQDRLFHQMLYQVAGNQMLADLADVFWIAYRNAEANTIPAARKGMSVLARHREILQAIEAKDVDQAQELIAGDRELEERLELALGHTSE